VKLKFRNKISVRELETLVHLGIILIAGLSTILRPSMESKITLFRVLLPFLFLWLFVVNTKRGIKLSLIIIGFFLYSLIASFGSRFHEINWAYNFYYITIFFFYFYYKEIIKRCNKETVYIFLCILYRTLIVLGLLQYFIGGVYFNTQNRFPAINLFFWNENEYSAILAIFTPLFFLKQSTYFKYIWIFLSIYLIAYNDAKLAILSLIIFFGGYFIMKFRLFRMRYIGFGLIGLIGVLVMFFAREYTIQGKYTIEYFISRLANGLFTGTALEHIGTFNSRSNAVIMGIHEFFNSYMIGIGPGNSLLMIQELIVPGQEKWAAYSMHNFTLQLVTEMGLFGVGILGFFVLEIKRSIGGTLYSPNLIWLFFFSCVVSITLLSGAWSNYFYLFILFYALDFFKNNEKSKI
jgi:hypothetical protein